MNPDNPYDEFAELEATAVRNFQTEKLLGARVAITTALHALARAGDIDADLMNRI